MAHVFAFLKEQPFALLFLVVGAGFILGKLKIFGISLGVVACTLIFGLLFGLWAQSVNISFGLPHLLQAIFFNRTKTSGVLSGL